MTRLTMPAQKPEPGGREARRSIAARTPRARKSRGSQVIGRPMFTRSPTIARVAGRNVRLPITETSDDAHRSDGHRREQRDAEREQPAERDDDGDAREEHRTTCRARGGLDRVLDAHAPPPFRPEARDHEQRVVDRHREAHQHDQLGGVRAHRPDRLAVEAEQAVRGGEARERKDQRDRGRDDRAERDQQDHERDRDGQPQRAVEVARDELVDVAVQERAADDMDAGVREAIARLLHDGLDGRELLLDHRALARHVADDLDGAPVGRDEAGLGPATNGSTTLSNVGCSAPSTVARAAVRSATSRWTCSWNAGSSGRVRAAVDDDDEPLRRRDRLALPEHLVRDLGLEARAVRVLEVVDGLDAARREARAERAERRRDPEREHEPAVPRGPRRDPDRPWGSHLEASLPAAPGPTRGPIPASLTWPASPPSSLASRAPRGGHAARSRPRRRRRARSR